MLNAITTDISYAVNSSNFGYHERLTEKLKTAAKTYWSILKTFKNGFKIPLTPPLSVGKRLVTDFLEKPNLLNSFLSKQCRTLVQNSSLSTNLTFETENRLFTFDFGRGDTKKSIRASD